MLRKSGEQKRGQFSANQTYQHFCFSWSALFLCQCQQPSYGRNYHVVSRTFRDSNSHSFLHGKWCQVWHVRTCFAFPACHLKKLNQIHSSNSVPRPAAFHGILFVHLLMMIRKDAQGIIIGGALKIIQIRIFFTTLKQPSCSETRWHIW